MNEHYQIIQRLSGINDSDIINVYPYGSRVYLTNTPTSDFDYIVVVKNSKDNGIQYDSHDGKISCHIYSEEHWQYMLDQQKIFALECHFLKIPLLIERRKFNYKLDKGLLRSEISAKASNSFVKCKKKLEVEKDYYIGIKSLFHSLRIPIFGTQIASQNEIYDYTAANYLWNEIINYYNSGHLDWNHYKTIYKPVQNKLLSEFRIYAEKIT